MDEEITLEEYIEAYNSEVYNVYPIFFREMNYINILAYYFNWIGECLFSEDVMLDKYKNSNISINDVLQIAFDIISDFGNGYKEEFEKCINDGTIEFVDADDNSYAYTAKENNHFSISVDRNYNIEDIIKLVHEFFHYLHIRKFDEGFKNEQCYLYGEMFSILGEIYAVLYLYKNNIFKDDAITYLKKEIMIIYKYANNTLIMGIVMHIYDLYNNFTDKSIDEYINFTNSPEEFVNAFDYLNDIEEFNYHELATYIIGFFPAFVLANSMIDDKSIIIRFTNCINHINEYKDKRELFNYLSIDNLLLDTISLSQLVDEMYLMFKQLYNNNEITYQKKLGELW